MPNASFDTQERREFARRLVTGFPVEDERLKGVALPASGMVWNHDQQHGAARNIPSKAVVLILTDDRKCETIFGFFKYPEDVLDIHGKTLAKTGLKNRWISRDFVDSPAPRFNKLSAGLPRPVFWNRNGTRWHRQSERFNRKLSVKAPKSQLK